MAVLFFLFFFFVLLSAKGLNFYCIFCFSLYFCRTDSNSHTQKKKKLRENQSITPLTNLNKRKGICKRKRMSSHKTLEGSYSA